MSQINYPVSFDGVDLSTVSGLTVLSTNPYAPPKRSLTLNDITRSNQSKISTGFYTEKNIVVSVGITRATRALLEQSLDSLYVLLQGLEKYLLIPQSGTTRRYTTTYADSIIKVSGGSYIEMDLVFACSDRFGYSLQYEKLLDATGRTLYNYTDSFTVNGSAPTQAPVITANLSALSGAVTNSVTIGNVGTGQTITVNRVWTSGDILVVDVQNSEVKVNGTNVDFTGGFPTFAPGVGYLNYHDDFTSRTLALSAYYNRRYV